MVDFKINKYYNKVCTDNDALLPLAILYLLAVPVISTVILFSLYSLTSTQWIILGIIFFIFMELSTLDFAYDDRHEVDWEDAFKYKIGGMLSAFHLTGTFIILPILLFKFGKYIYPIIVDFFTEELMTLFVIWLGRILLIIAGIYLFFKINHWAINYVRRDKDKNIVEKLKLRINERRKKRGINKK